METIKRHFGDRTMAVLERYARQRQMNVDDLIAKITAGYIHPVMVLDSCANPRTA